MKKTNLVLTLVDGELTIPVLDQIGPNEISFTFGMLRETLSRLNGVMYAGNQIVKATLARPEETIELI